MSSNSCCLDFGENVYFYNVFPLPLTSVPTYATPSGFILCVRSSVQCPLSFHFTLPHLLSALVPSVALDPGEESGNQLQYSCLKNPMDRKALRATVHGVAKNWIQLSD